MKKACKSYEYDRVVYLGLSTFVYQTGDNHLLREGILFGDDLDGIFLFSGMLGIIDAQPKLIRESAGNMDRLCHLLLSCE